VEKRKGTTCDFITREKRRRAQSERLSAEKGTSKRLLVKGATKKKFFHIGSRGKRASMNASEATIYHVHGWEKKKEKHGRDVQKKRYYKLL